MGTNNRKRHLEDWKIGLQVTFGLSFIVGAFVWWQTETFWIGLITAIGLGIITFIYSILGKRNGLRRHREAVDEDVFIDIMNEFGFEEEQEGDYRGLFGTYKGYFYRVYYTHESFINKIDYAICVMLYFKPIVIFDGSLDVPFYDRINGKFKAFFRRRIFAETHEWKIEASYVRCDCAGMSYKKFEKGLNRCLEIAQEFGLEPISKSEVDALISENRYWHGPDIETFQDP